MDTLRKDLGDDVDDQEGQGTERNRPVRRLDEHPLPRMQEHPVRGPQPEPARCAQSDQRENARVKEHEVLGCGVDNVTDTGQREECDDYDYADERDRIDLCRVLGRHPASRWSSVLTAAVTAASRGHEVTSWTVGELCRSASLHRASATAPGSASLG